MTAWFRSAEMVYCNLVVQDHVARDCVAKLGDLGAVQFSDLNGDVAAFQRRFTPFLRRCDDAERVLRFLEAEMRKEGVVPKEASLGDFNAWLQREERLARGRDGGGSLLEAWEERLATHEREMTQMADYRETLLDAYMRKVEARYVIDSVDDFFAHGGPRIEEERQALRPDMEARAAAGGAGYGVGAARPSASKKGSYGLAGFDSPGSTKAPLLGSGTSVIGGSGEVLAFEPLALGGGLPAAGDAEAKPATRAGDADAHAGDADARAGDADGDGSAAAAPSASAGFVPADRSMAFQHVAGVLLRDDRLPFERMLFRISRGNCYARFVDIDDELETESGETCFKTVFIIMFRAESLANKLRRLMDAFNAHRYELPAFDNPHDVARTTQALEADIDQAARLLTEHRRTSLMALRDLAETHDLVRKGVQREKAIYHTLNMFHADMAGILRAQGWVVRDAIPKVQSAISDAHASVGGGAGMPSFLDRVDGRWPTPPTYFKTNKFTALFQETVDTYGVPRYREANPALFTTITFPFLFGVMYGDVGHAGFLALFAFLMVAFESRLASRKLGEVGSMLFNGRYLLLMMGLFGVYAGLIYNDTFSLGLNLFGSRWRLPTGASAPPANASRVLVRAGPDDDVYTFGIDPAWHVSTNDLLFANSLKMKMSVILGVAQMLFGVFLKFTNAIHARSRLDVWAECVPQLIFMLVFLGYMVFLIFYKWSIDWSDPPAPASAPPSLIDTLIAIALAPGTVRDPMFHGQATIQVLVLVVMFLCVPWMLLVKPLLLRRWHRQEVGEGREDRGLYADVGGVALGEVALHEGADPPGAAHDPLQSDHSSGGHGHGDHEVFDFGEIFTHQSIETIEFVLGCVSHTASYLRLWALSLAHSELALVFYERALIASIQTGNGVLIFVGYAIFAAATTGVLLMMDVLECFLHALRLHWVEFQSKFFRADGYKFEPFAFRTVLK